MVSESCKFWVGGVVIYIQACALGKNIGFEDKGMNSIKAVLLIVILPSIQPCMYNYLHLHGTKWFCSFVVTSTAECWLLFLLSLWSSIHPFCFYIFCQNCVIISPLRSEHFSIYCCCCCFAIISSVSTDHCYNHVCTTLQKATIFSPLVWIIRQWC